MPRVESRSRMFWRWEPKPMGKFANRIESGELSIDKLIFTSLKLGCCKLCITYCSNCTFFERFENNVEIHNLNFLSEILFFSLHIFEKCNAF